MDQNMFYANSVALIQIKLLAVEIFHGRVEEK